jgi:DNA-binding response OmpR family regulator
MPTRLLWADADKILTDASQRFFSRFDFDVRTAGDGVECQSQLHEFQPDVLVLDSSLPWDGPNGCLHGDGAQLSLQLVLATGGEPADIISDQTGLPAAHCVPKPFRLWTVLDRIRASMDESRELDEDAACFDV